MTKSAAQRDILLEISNAMDDEAKDMIARLNLQSDTERAHPPTGGLRREDRQRRQMEKAIIAWSKLVDGRPAEIFVPVTSRLLKIARRLRKGAK